MDARYSFKLFKEMIRPVFKVVTFADHPDKKYIQFDSKQTFEESCQLFSKFNLDYMIAHKKNLVQILFDPNKLQMVFNEKNFLQILNDIAKKANWIGEWIMLPNSDQLAFRGASPQYYLLIRDKNPGPNVNKNMLLDHIKLKFPLAFSTNWSEEKDWVEVRNNYGHYFIFKGKKFSDILHNLNEILKDPLKIECAVQLLNQYFLLPELSQLVKGYYSEHEELEFSATPSAVLR